MTNCSFQCIKPLEQGATHTSTSGNNFSTMNLTGTISSSAGPFAHNSTQSAAADATYGFGSGYSAFYVGLALALGHSLFDGVSFLLKKLGQNRVARRGHDTARGSFHYLCDGVWWVGMLLSAPAAALTATATATATVTATASFSYTRMREALRV